MQDQSLTTLQNELGSGSTSAVPSLDMSALMPLMMTSLIVTGVFTLLFVVYILYTTIRRYKVEKATLDMQKDIRRMRELMEEQAKTDVSPKLDLLAHHDDTDETSQTTTT